MLAAYGWMAGSKEVWTTMQLAPMALAREMAAFVSLSYKAKDKSDEVQCDRDMDDIIILKTSH